MGTARWNIIFYAELNGGAEEYIKTFTVTPDDAKRIYLIANEEGVDGAGATGSLHAQLQNMNMGDGGFEALVSDVCFTLDDSKNIPMSSVYDIEPITQGTRRECNFYVVRAAVKFNLKFVNNRTGDLNVSKVRLSQVAAHSYLMSHLDENAGYYSDDNGDGVIVRHDFAKNSNGSSLWIDWLKVAVDESNQSPTDETLADRRGWIMEYSLPQGAEHFTTPEFKSFEIKANGGEYELPAYYCAESRNDIMQNSFFAPGLEQQYYLSMLIEDEDGGSRREYTWPNDALKLPNVRALFRNTNVVTTVTFGERETCIYARIVEWGRVPPRNDTIEYN